MKIGIIGSGNVGITSAFAIAEKGSGHITLYGRTPGRAEGKALDLVEAGPIRRYDRRIRGTSDLGEVLESDILVLAAGQARQAGMSRFDLLTENLAIVREIARRLETERQRETPPVTIVLTEPVDLMTLAFQQTTGWPRERVFGVGGLLSASRLRHLLARELGLAAADVDAMVVGTHTEQEVILERYCRISGLPLERFLDRERLDDLFARTLEAGTEIVEQAKVGSSFYTPGAAVGALVDAIVTDAHRVLPVSVVLDGEFGASGLAASVPARVGRDGAEQIFALELTPEEQQAFDASVAVQRPYLDQLSEGGSHA